jgi:hypothetical protein
MEPLSTKRKYGYGQNGSNLPGSDCTDDAGHPRKSVCSAAPSLVDLTDMPRDVRHESFKFLSLTDLSSFLRSSKACREDVKTFFERNGGGLRLIHSAELFAASDAYFSDRCEETRCCLDQIMKRPGCKPDESFTLLLGDESDRTFDMLVKSKLLRVPSVDLSDAHRKFLCSDWAVRQLYRHPDVDLAAFARIPERFLAPMGLHLAIGAGNAEALDAMLRCRLFDINAANTYGVAPLDVARFSRNEAAVDMLIQHGADASSTDERLTSRKFEFAACPEEVLLDIDES